MKKVKFIAFFLLSFVFVLTAQAQNGKSKKADPSADGAAIIKTSAQCEMCKERIEKAVLALNGVKTAELNIENKELRVSFNSSKILADDIRKEVNRVGYDADGMEADKDAYKKLPRCCQKSE